MKILSRLIPLTNIYWVPTAEMNLTRSLPFSVECSVICIILFYYYFILSFY